MRLLTAGFLKKKFVLLSLCSLWIFFGSSPIWAQTGVLTGEVLDPSGAGVPHAKVTLINNQTKLSQTAATDTDGRYSLSSVPPGEYTLSVDASGFARYEQTSVSVQASQNLTLDVKLKVEGASQSVTIHGVDIPTLLETPMVGKTGTKLEDLPANIQIIPSAVLTEQGSTMLREGITNASGVNFGGQDSKGFYDHFLIRGLNATIYSDGFSDGDQLGGLSHSLNGVKEVEILEGPGSALFGSGSAGGTINIVHFQPSPDFHFSDSLQGGSFGTVTNSLNITGSTGIQGLNYRIDSVLSRTDGFRDLASHDYEVRPTLEWKRAHHTIDFAVDLRHVFETPDSYGLIYLNGTPIQNVSIDAKYSTPFASAYSDFVRPTITDRWDVSDFLTINNRFSYLYRTLDALGNGDSTSTKVSGGAVVGRQLRQQDDTDGSFDYQFEPVWKFKTGKIRHTLLTGFETQHLTIDTSRSTADLPDIPNAFAPVPPEKSVADVQFLCDSKHSCDDDHLNATYFGVYATDQVDLTSKLKIRAGFRQDWFNTSLTPLITVPGRFRNRWSASGGRRDG